ATCRCWRDGSSARSGPTPAGKRPCSPPTPSARWPRTRGPATCASCAMCSSARCSLVTAARSSAGTWGSSPATRRGTPRPGGPGGTLADLERTYIERVLREERQHVGRAAERLGIPRSTFYQKLRSLGILTPRARVLALDRRKSG